MGGIHQCITDPSQADNSMLPSWLCFLLPKQMSPYCLSRPDPQMKESWVKGPWMKTLTLQDALYLLGLRCGFQEPQGRTVQ